MVDSIFINNNASSGGAVYLWSAKCNLTGCNFINNTAKNYGGAIYWNGIDGTISSSTFTGNIAKNYHGGAISWTGSNGILTSSTFSNNSANRGGSIDWRGTNGILTSSTFSNNSANRGGAVYWSYNTIDGLLCYSNFINNRADDVGGGIFWEGTNCNIIGSNFNNNTANRGGAIFCAFTCPLTNCSFINGKSQEINGIYTNRDLNINGGNGIVYVFVNGTLSGASIVVLNNETYYYPPNSNINLPTKNKNTEDKKR